MAKKTENTEEQPVIENPEETTIETTEPVVEGTEETPVATTEDMVKVVVLKRFLDKYDHRTWFEVGDEPEFESERAADVIERGLAKLKE